MGIGGNALGRSHIKFVGYINQETIQYNYDAGYVEFEILSPTKIMEITECFSVSVESKNSPTTWYELLDMNCARALYHYYAWHSTVLQNCDFVFNVSNDRYIQYFDAARESLFSAGNTLMEGTLKGRLVCDSQGRIYAERNVDVINNASATLSTALSITKRDWINEPIINYRYHNEVSFIEMGGINYDPDTGASVALLAGAPGLAPAYHGKVERIQGLALLDQAELNTLAGNLYASMNRKYVSVEYKLRGSYWNLDIAPQEKVVITMQMNESPFNVSWSAKSFAIVGVDRTYNSNEKVVIAKISLQEITQGFDGDTIVIPEIPPVDDEDGGTYSNPVVPPTTGTIASTYISIPIYHNNVFVGNANILNFLDDSFASTGTS